jgi:hypothetical protein
MNPGYSYVLDADAPYQVMNGYGWLECESKTKHHRMKELAELIQIIRILNVCNKLRKPGAVSFHKHFN